MHLLVSHEHMHTHSYVCIFVRGPIGKQKNLRTCVSYSPDMYVITSSTIQLKKEQILYTIISNTDSPAKKTKHLYIHFISNCNLFINHVSLEDVTAANSCTLHYI
jgi:hypothetical protein